ncbi:MAG: TonB-dependent receptor [Acidobacteriota bacterium]
MKVFGFILFLAASVFAQSSGTVTGRVISNLTDDSDGSHAIVVLTSTKDPKDRISTKCDANGNFSLENVPPGDYRITGESDVSAVPLFGEKVIRVASGQNPPVELTVTNSVRIRETVNVAADATQTLEQVSKTVDVIGGQEMRDRADFALVDTLRTVPGFRVQQLGGFGRTATIKTRGLRNQDTAILIDGIRFRDVSSITGDASAFLGDFTLTSVSKIEVLRGSGSSLYGTNAIGGVVDFQTPQPTEELHGQVSAATGGLGLKRFRANVSDSLAKGKIGFTLGVSRTAYTEGIDKDDDADNTNIQNRIEFHPARNTHLSARFFVSNAFVRLNADPDTLNAPPSNFGVTIAQHGVNFISDADDPDSTQKSKFFNGQFVLSHAFSSKILFEGSYSGLITSRKNDNGTLGPGFQSASTSIFDGNIHTANAHINWVPNAFNQVTAGYEFEYEKFGNDGITPTGAGDFFTRAFQSSHTFYIQDMVQLFDRRLQLAGGFRAQFFDLKSPEFSLTNAPYSGVVLSGPPPAYTFDGSAAYSFSTGTKLRAHVGNGYRVPSLYERFGTFFNTFTFPGPNRFEALGDPMLEPEKTIAFDTGIEQSLFDDRARLSATYFYTKLLDTIGFGSTVWDIGTTTRRFGGYLNTKGGIARGAELSAKVRPTSTTDIFVSYTYTNSDQIVQQVAGSGVTRTLGIPSQQFTVVATQRVGRFWANFDLLATNGYLAPIFSSETFNSYVFRFRGNRRADVTAGYTFPLRKDRFELRLYGTIENVFDHNYYENGFRTPGRSARVGLALSF